MEWNRVLCVKWVAILFDFVFQPARRFLRVLRRRTLIRMARPKPKTPPASLVPRMYPRSGQREMRPPVRDPHLKEMKMSRQLRMIRSKSASYNRYHELGRRHKKSLETKQRTCTSEEAASLNCTHRQNPPNGMSS